MPYPCENFGNPIMVRCANCGREKNHEDDWFILDTDGVDIWYCDKHCADRVYQDNYMSLDRDEIRATGLQWCNAYHKACLEWGG